MRIRHSTGSFFGHVSPTEKSVSRPLGTCPVGLPILVKGRENTFRLVNEGANGDVITPEISQQEGGNELKKVQAFAAIVQAIRHLAWKFQLHVMRAFHRRRSSTTFSINP